MRAWYAALGDRIARRRRELGLTVCELAGAVLPAAAVARWESGRPCPLHFYYAGNLADALGMTLDELYGSREAGLAAGDWAEGLFEAAGTPPPPLFELMGPMADALGVTIDELYPRPHDRR